MERLFGENCSPKGDWQLSSGKRTRSLHNAGPGHKTMALYKLPVTLANLSVLPPQFEWVYSFL